MGKIMNQQELLQALSYWQEKLNLVNWEIEAKISRAANMRPNSQGSVNWTIHNKQATINLLDPIDYPDDVMGGQDMEKTLVHELLHINLAPIANEHGEDEHYTLFEEWAINDISHALINLHRQIK